MARKVYTQLLKVPCKIYGKHASGWIFKEKKVDENKLVICHVSCVTCFSCNETLWCGEVAQLVSDPPQWKSTIKQNQPIYNPSPNIVVTFKAIIIFFNPSWFRIFYWNVLKIFPWFYCLGLATKLMKYYQRYLKSIPWLSLGLESVFLNHPQTRWSPDTSVLVSLSDPVEKNWNYQSV